MRMRRYLLLTTYFTCAAVSGVFCQSFSPPTDDICPGDNVTFTCVIVDDGTRFTRWTVTPGGADPRCTVEHPDPLTESCGPMNSFTSSLTGSSGTSYTTTLSVESIPDSLNGTIVECTNSTGDTIGSDDICIVEGVLVPSQLIAATVSKRGVGADECVVSINWSEAVISCGGSVSQYELCGTQGSEDCVNLTTQTRYDLTVAMEQTHSLTVTAFDRCGNNQTGNLVPIQLRDGTRNCNTTDIQYDGSSGVLKDVTITWNAFVLEGPFEDITYNVYLESTSDYSLNQTATLNQTDAMTYTYTFSVPDVIAEYISMVEANIPCASKVKCQPQPIFTEEDDFCEGISVDETDPAKATIICSLLPSLPLPVAWQCTALCGLSQRLWDLNISANSYAGSSDQNITIELHVREHPLVEHTTYHCVVSATRSNDSTTLCRERLQFTTTGCVPSDLLQSSRGPECQTSVNGECTEFVICSDDGIVCAVYNGKSESSIAVYYTTTDYCLIGPVERICDGENWSGEEPITEEVTTETKLEDWNIALIAIGVTAYIIGVCVATVLGTLLFLRANTRSDGVLAVVVLISSVLLFPLAAVLYCVMKKKEFDEKGLDLKRWYKFLVGASVVITIICFIMWLVLIGYTTSQDFYDEGYRRGGNSECIPTDGDEAEKRVRNGLVIVYFVLSLLVLVEWSVCAALWRCGVVGSASEKKESPPAVTYEEVGMSGEASSSAHNIQLSSNEAYAPLHKDNIPTSRNTAYGQVQL